MIRVNGKPHPWQAGLTVSGLLEDLKDSHHYVVVRINDRHICRPDFEKTPVPDNSDVFLLPMIVGG